MMSRQYRDSTVLGQNKKDGGIVPALQPTLRLMLDIIACLILFSRTLWNYEGDFGILCQMVFSSFSVHPCLSFWRQLRKWSQRSNSVILNWALGGWVSDNHAVQCKTACLNEFLDISGTIGMAWLCWHVIELDAVGCQFEPYLTTGCVCTATPLWCGLGCRSRNSHCLIKPRSLPFTLLLWYHSFPACVVVCPFISDIVSAGGLLKWELESARHHSQQAVQSQDRPLSKTSALHFWRPHHPQWCVLADVRRFFESQLFELQPVTNANSLNPTLF